MSWRIHGWNLIQEPQQGGLRGPAWGLLGAPGPRWSARLGSEPDAWLDYSTSKRERSDIGLPADGLLRTYSASLSGPELLLQPVGGLRAVARRCSQTGALREQISWLVSLEQTTSLSADSAGCVTSVGDHAASPARRTDAPQRIGCELRHSGDVRYGDSLEIET